MLVDLLIAAVALLFPAGAAQNNAGELTDLRRGVAKIVTPYNAKEWHNILSKCNLLSQFPNLAAKITHGFSLGDSLPPINRTYTPPNHRSALSNPAAVNEFITTEQRLGRIEGPYNKKEVERRLGGSFRTSPLGVVEKAGSPGKFRVIRDFSFRGNQQNAVNDWLNSDDFPTEWGSAGVLGSFISSAPKGTLAASIDIESAYRTIPVVPSQWAYIVISHEGKYWIDKCLPFGASPSGGIHGETVDAFKAILKWHGIDEVIKWVDDIVPLIYPIESQRQSQPFKYRIGLPFIESLAKSLGIPLHPTKKQDFKSSVVYVGFFWDLERKSVAILDEKKAKYITKINAFTKTARAGGVNLKEVQSLHGSLAHCTYVVPRGRSYLIRIQEFMKTFDTSNPSQRLETPKQVLKDIEWWKRVLARTSLSRTLNPLEAKDKKDVDVGGVSQTRGWGWGLFGWGQ